MRLDAESKGPQLCGKGHDPRVTRVGKVLRSLHLDELPRFWNVLKGDMSLIGPRPERLHFTLQYAKKIPLYTERTRLLKPGLTGLAQITLGYDDSLESVIRKTHFDLAYRLSLIDPRVWLKVEAWIIFNTLVYLFRGGRPLGQAWDLQDAADPAAAVPTALAMSLVRYRDTLNPALVTMRGRADLNGKLSAPSAPSGERMDVRHHD